MININDVTIIMVVIIITIAIIIFRTINPGFNWGKMYFLRPSIPFFHYSFISIISFALNFSI